MKQIPNFITLVRIFCGLILLFIKPATLVFFAIYLLGGLSDILDGFLARKMNIATKLGAALDSIADFVFIAVLMIVFIPLIAWPSWLIIWIITIVIVRFFSLVTGLIKYGALAFLHTYTNKLTGLALFAFPFFYYFLGLSITGVLLCSVATISAIEELFINLSSATLNRNITSILKLNKKAN